MTTTIDMRAEEPGELAVVLTGGGARAAYQVGFLRVLARRLPELRFDVITGISAGAINASLLASHPGTLHDAAEELTNLWSRLNSEDVFRVDSRSLSRQMLTWGARLFSGGGRLGKASRGFVDTQPLRRLLQRTLAPLGPGSEIAGIRRNLERGRLSACAIVTLDYSSGKTVIWIEGRGGLEAWQRQNRRAVQGPLTVEHVMASSSLPLFFPAVRLGRDWHGDGGIRLAAPFSPSLHLGARRILAVSTRHLPSPGDDRPRTSSYPAPAQILGHLFNAVFLDVLDEDAARVARTSDLVSRLSPEERGGMSPVDLLVLRPSVDLGALAADYEPKLPSVFRFLTRGLGTIEGGSSDLLSMLMFQPDFLSCCIETGEADAEARLGDIERLVTPRPSPGHRLRGSGGAP